MVTYLFKILILPWDQAFNSSGQWSTSCHSRRHYLNLTHISPITAKSCLVSRTPPYHYSPISPPHSQSQKPSLPIILYLGLVLAVELEASKFKSKRVSVVHPTRNFRPYSWIVPVFSTLSLQDKVVLWLARDMADILEARKQEKISSSPRFQPLSPGEHCFINPHTGLHRYICPPCLQQWVRRDRWCLLRFASPENNGFIYIQPRGQMTMR